MCFDFLGAACRGRADHEERCSTTDNNGKLALLYDLERIATLLRDGNEPFHPERDRPAFERYLVQIGCQPPLSSKPR